MPQPTIPQIPETTGRPIRLHCCQGIDEHEPTCPRVSLPAAPGILPPVSGGWRLGSPSEFGTHNANIMYDGQGNGVCQIYGIWSHAKLESVIDDPRCADGLAKGFLMAAAPDLLFALERIIEDLPIKRDWLDPAIEQAARDAILIARKGRP